MYWLIDELIVPITHESVFIGKLPYFRSLYFQVSGVTSVIYARTRLKANMKTTIRNPSSSFLLIISFDSQNSFKSYHDNSNLANQIHKKIAAFFDDNQLKIRTSLHGEEI